MGTATHTPGPWAIDMDAAVGGTARVYSNHGTVAECSGIKGGPSSLSQAIANARLIAAAPDMLQVLLRVAPFVSSLPGQRGRESLDYLEQMRAVTARATGRIYVRTEGEAERCWLGELPTID